MARRRENMVVKGLDGAATTVVVLIACSTMGILALATQHAAWLYAGWVPWVVLLAVRRPVLPRSGHWVNIAITVAAISWSLTLLGLFFHVRVTPVDGGGRDVLGPGVWVHAGLPWPGVVGSLSGSGNDTLPLVGGMDVMLVNFLGIMLVVAPIAMRASVARVASAAGWVIGICCMACLVGGWRLVALLD
jgi:hypothetical protein